MIEGILSKRTRYEKMKIIKLGTMLLGIFMIFAGLAHFVKPQIYYPYIPKYLSVRLVNALAGIMETLFGIGLFLPKFKKISALVVLCTMIGYFPFHIIHISENSSLMNEFSVMHLSIPIQTFLIFWGYWVWNDTEKNQVEV